MIVFIDGENFRQHIVEELLEQNLIESKSSTFSFNIRGLLVDILGTDDLTINYYASKIRTPSGYTPSQNILRIISSIQIYYRDWFRMLHDQGINVIKAGNLKVRDGKECPNCHTVSEVLQEKGVDVRMALDMLESAYSTNEEIVSVSSDTDLCPTYPKIHQKDVEVTYVGFSTRINRAVSASVGSTVTITPAKIAQYFIQ